MISAFTTTTWATVPHSSSSWPWEEDQSTPGEVSCSTWIRGLLAYWVCLLWSLLHETDCWLHRFFFFKFQWRIQIRFAKWRNSWRLRTMIYWTSYLEMVKSLFSYLEKVNATFSCLVSRSTPQSCFNQFLVAETQHYKRLCQSVGPLVHASVHQVWVENAKNGHLRCYSGCVGVCVG